MKKVVIFLVIMFFITGCSVKKLEEQTDSEKFAIEYSISEDNPFLYTSIDEVTSLFTDGNGIIFLGNSDGEWSRLCVKILNQVFSKMKIEKVYYFNLKVAEDEYPKKYNKLVNKISKFLKEDEKLQTPALFLLKNGKVIGYSLDYETITEGNNEGYTKSEQKKLKNKYIKLIEQYQKEDA